MRTVFLAVIASAIVNHIFASLVVQGNDILCDDNSIVDYLESVHGIILTSTSDCRFKGTRQVLCSGSCYSAGGFSTESMGSIALVCQKGIWKVNKKRTSLSCQAESLVDDFDCGGISLQGHLEANYQQVSSCTEGTNKGVKCDTSCASPAENTGSIPDGTQVKYVCKKDEWKSWPRLRCQITDIDVSIEVSSTGTGFNKNRLIDGSGLSGDGTDATCTGSTTGLTSWISSAVDVNPVITISYSPAMKFNTVSVWPYSIDGLYGTRSVKTFELELSSDGGTNYQKIGTEYFLDKFDNLQGDPLLVDVPEGSYTNLRITSLLNHKNKASDIHGLCEIRPFLLK